MMVNIYFLLAFIYGVESKAFQPNSKGIYDHMYENAFFGDKPVTFKRVQNSNSEMRYVPHVGGQPIFIPPLAPNQFEAEIPAFQIRRTRPIRWNSQHQNFKNVNKNLQSQQEGTKVYLEKLNSESEVMEPLTKHSGHKIKSITKSEENLYQIPKYDQVIKPFSHEKDKNYIFKTKEIATSGYERDYILPVSKLEDSEKMNEGKIEAVLENEREVVDNVLQEELSHKLKPIFSEIKENSYSKVQDGYDSKEPLSHGKIKDNKIKFPIHEINENYGKVKEYIEESNVLNYGNKGINTLDEKTSLEQTPIYSNVNDKIEMSLTNGMLKHHQNKLDPSNIYNRNKETISKEKFSDEVSEEIEVQNDGEIEPLTKNKSGHKSKPTLVKIEDEQIQNIDLDKVKHVTRKPKHKPTLHVNKHNSNYNIKIEPSKHGKPNFDNKFEDTPADLYNNYNSVLQKEISIEKFHNKKEPVVKNIYDYEESEVLTKEKPEHKVKPILKEPALKISYDYDSIEPLSHGKPKPDHIKRPVGNKIKEEKSDVKYGYDGIDYLLLEKPKHDQLLNEIETKEIIKFDGETEPLSHKKSKHHSKTKIKEIPINEYERNYESPILEQEFPAKLNVEVEEIPVDNDEIEMLSNHKSGHKSKPILTKIVNKQVQNLKYNYDKPKRHENPKPILHGNNQNTNYYDTIKSLTNKNTKLENFDKESKFEYYGNNYVSDQKTTVEKFGKDEQSLVQNSLDSNVEMLTNKHDQKVKSVIKAESSYNPEIEQVSNEKKKHDKDFPTNEYDRQYIKQIESAQPQDYSKENTYNPNLFKNKVKVNNDFDEVYEPVEVIDAVKKSSHKNSAKDNIDSAIKQNAQSFYTSSNEEQTPIEKLTKKSESHDKVKFPDAYYNKNNPENYIYKPASREILNSVFDPDEKMSGSKTEPLSKNKPSKHIKPIEVVNTNEKSKYNELQKQDENKQQKIEEEYDIPIIGSLKENLDNDYEEYDRPAVSIEKEQIDEDIDVEYDSPVVVEAIVKRNDKNINTEYEYDIPLVVEARTVRETAKHNKKGHKLKGGNKHKVNSISKSDTKKINKKTKNYYKSPQNFNNLGYYHNEENIYGSQNSNTDEMSNEFSKSNEQIENIAETDQFDIGSGMIDQRSSNFEEHSDFTPKSNAWSLLSGFHSQERNKFKKCITPNNEQGNCMPIQMCPVPNLDLTLDDLLKKICTINEVFIGICCPEFPAETLKVKWDNLTENIADKEGLKNVETESKECGVLQESEKELSSWPWMAPLISVSTRRIFCGGVLVSEQYVLTAAHCTRKVPHNQILVVLGPMNDVKTTERQEFEVIEIKRHAQYNTRTMQNDIALLKLSRSVTLSTYSRFICISREESLVSTKAIMLGWQGSFAASTNEESLLVISPDECRRRGMGLTDSMLCTEPRTEDMMCNLDSGAPLITKLNGKYEVLGLLAWNRNDCDSRFPATFTKVSHFRKWIENHIS